MHIAPVHDDLESWHGASGLKLYDVYINDDAWLYLTYFALRIKLISYEASMTQDIQRMVILL